MKRSAPLAPILLLALLLAPAPSRGADVPYFPYETIEKYYQPPPEVPPVAQPPGNQQPAEPPGEATRKGQPPAITAPPEFLFPAGLGFGVAVGVPYDMMYLDKEYYLWQGGKWYRSTLYRGPWTEIGYSQLPPELRRVPLGKIRVARNKEFQTYWKDREGYQGKRFRPGGEMKEERANGNGKGR